jgi:hypothetical protein
MSSRSGARHPEDLLVWENERASQHPGEIRMMRSCWFALSFLFLAALPARAMTVAPPPLVAPAN